MKHLKRVLLILLVFLAAAPAVAQDKRHIDVNEILWGHIKDSYEWHITAVGGHPVSIPLPVIVRTTTGWHIFSSAAFAHEADAEGNRPGPYGLMIKSGEAKEYPNKIVERVGTQEIRPLDLSITKTVCVLFVDAIILLLCILIPARWCRKHKVDDPAPRGFTGLIHLTVMSVYNDLILATLGEKDAKRFGPWLLTCFFFIFIANLMGVVPFPPGGGNLTGNITCTFFLAFTTFLITNFTGTRAYWQEVFWPEVPTWLKVPVPLMPFIELCGVITKPFALMIRLFANMFAGHAIALSFAAIIFIMFHISESAVANYLAGTSMTVVSVAMSVFMMLLELLVCYIQAVVFTMLSAVFISLAHVRHEHPEHPLPAQSSAS